MSERQVILASGSPRRLELMERIGFEPRVEIADIEERRELGENPSAYTRRLAAEKAATVAKRVNGEHWVLAADTIVVLDGEVLEKPHNRKEAISMLERLSGRTHVVVTSFCWMNSGDLRERTQSVRASVEFRELSPMAIERYVDSGVTMDKAGGYGIQDVGSTFVRRIDGSYFCVMGLPVCEVVEVLQELGGLREYPF